MVYSYIFKYIFNAKPNVALLQLTLNHMLHVQSVNVGINAVVHCKCKGILTLRLLISYIYGAPSKARNANVVYIWIYVWQR